MALITFRSLPLDPIHAGIIISSSFLYGIIIITICLTSLHLLLPIDRLLPNNLLFLEYTTCYYCIPCLVNPPRFYLCRLPSYSDFRYCFRQDSNDALMISGKSIDNHSLPEKKRPQQKQREKYQLKKES